MPRSLSAEVQSELSILFEDADLLGQVLPQLREGRLSDDRALRWIEIAGVAATIEKIYSGIERVLLLLARHVDRTPIEKTDAWHATLLDRMANPFPGVRGPVISAEGKVGLDRLRSFRHRVRNSYSIALDAEIVLDRAGELSNILLAFQRDVGEFLSAWPPP